MIAKFKIGDTVKCTSCKRVYKMYVCPDCSDMHPEVQTQPPLEITAKWKVCPGCGTGPELAALRNFVKTQQAGMLS